MADPGGRFGWRRPKRSPATGRSPPGRQQDAEAEARDRPVAVLVQWLVRPVLGGVLFGVDPVTGRSDRRVVTAVRGGRGGVFQIDDQGME